MPQITIPKSAYPAIRRLIDFSVSDFAAFLGALSKAEPSLDQDNFWEHVSSHVKDIPPEVIKSVLNEIFAMERTISKEGLSIDEFATAVCDAMALGGSKDLSVEEKEKQILYERLVNIFNGGKGLNITLKAANVLTDQDHIFLSTRILTDIRPIFNEKGTDVDAVVIVHNMRIHYVENSDHKDFYVALDTNDIQKLREVIDRADTKAKCLESLLKTSGVSYLDAKN